MRTDARRNRRGHVHNQSAGTENRRARSRNTALIEYYRQIFWSSGVDLPDDDTLAKWVKETTLDSLELSAGEKAALSLQLPEGYVIVFDPVLHISQHIEVKGEPTRESQSLSFVMTRDHVPAGP